MGDRDSGFATGFLFGAIVGAAIGLLYAPRPGKEIRAIIRQKAEEVRDKSSEIIERTKEAAEKAGNRVRERLAE